MFISLFILAYFKNKWYLCIVNAMLAVSRRPACYAATSRLTFCRLLSIGYML